MIIEIVYTLKYFNKLTEVSREKSDGNEASGTEDAEPASGVFHRLSLNPQHPLLK
jgi:hypothetical protein